MDEPRKPAFFPVSVRWFGVPMNGMKRGFNYLKKRVDQLIDDDQTRHKPAGSKSTTEQTGKRAHLVPRPPANPSVGNHLNTYA
jgi:hypothetical protein